MVKDKPQIEMPSVLAFDRKLEPSDALMYSGCWESTGKNEGWQAIKLIDRRNRGVKSNFKKEVLENEEELQKQIEEPNPVWGDDAALPHQHDTLKVSFTLRVVGGVGTASTCNKTSFQDSLINVTEEYTKRDGFNELAKRYANNIANGRFLWRNRVGAESVKISVAHTDLDTPCVFDNYSIRDIEHTDTSLGNLTEIIAKGLRGDAYALLHVDAYVKLGEAQRVWPSQEMIMNIPKGEKSRHLFSLNGCAAIHSQKIGNALRTIDNWYGEDVSPIAVEPYGSVTHKGIAMRKSKNDFNTLINKWVIKGEEILENEQHFVMAVLIRGGVFGESD